MASTQAAPGMQPQPGSMPFAPNINKDQIQLIYAKYQQMKAAGVRQDDPEFLKAQNFLRQLRQRSLAQQQRANYQQQQQLQQQQQGLQQPQVESQAQKHQDQSNGGNPQAATNGEAKPAASTAPSNTPTSTTVPNASGQQGSSTRPGSSTAQQNPTFTAEQFTMLRMQISAFKQLSRNLPLPSNLRQQIFPQQPKAVRDQKDSVTVLAPGAGDTTPATTDAAATADVDPNKRHYETFTDPYTMLGAPLTYSDHSIRTKRQVLPSIMPIGIDVDRFVEERENIVYNRMVARKAELEKLPANLSVWRTAKTDSPTEDHTLKLKAVIEYKKLCLLPKQRLLRAAISREMLHSDNLAMTANRSLYRRIKKQSLREARITEKLEKQQRDARETKEKKKHTDFLRSIVSHGEEIHKSAMNHRQRIQKLGRMMMVTHQNIEKEELKRVERTAKQRLQALKANDEETYLKLLGQAKDTRISHLLKQTDGFLKQLAASVKEQQRSANRRYGIEQAPESESESEDDDEGGKGKNVDYFEVAHRIKEDIHAQSSNLVGGTLKEYQIKGLQWMISLYNNNLNGILADEMGLGKTIQTISLITYLIEKKQQPGPYLVIVPLSTLTNWNSEFEKWAPSVVRIVYKGPPNQRKTQQQQIRYGQFQVLLTTYEFVIKDRPILSKVKWIHMIVDEGHRMKNAGSKLSVTITQYYTTRYRLILTGTPLQNNLPELWALLNFVLPTIFKSVKSFDEWFNTPFANTGGQDKMELSEEEQLLVIRRLHKVLRPFLLRRLKRDVEKDLPEKTERVIKCNFSALQARLYKQLVQHQRLVVSDGKGGKTGMRGLSNMLMQLRKLCNHPFVFEEVEDQMNPGRLTNDLLWRTAGKFELLDRILPKFKATGHRVLMFFQMTQIMNIMEDFMRLRGFQYLRLDGSTKADDRSELLRLFNAPNSPYFCFLLSTRAGGLGLNLQTADTVIIYDSDWNPHQDLQAQDRAHRIGQKNEVRILRLISSNSVEEKILERANYKLDMDGKVIQAGKFDNRSTNEERDAMLRIMLESAEAAESLEQDEMDDEDLNLMMMRSEEELPIFRKFDADRLNDKYGPGKKYPRLLGESELPELYMNDDAPIEEVIEETYGRGARERTRVKYDDGLTEEQWLEAVDADDDTVEDAVRRKEDAARRKDERKARDTGKKGGKGGRGDSATPEPPVISREPSESPPPKKRGRKPKAVANGGSSSSKRNADEASLDGDIVPPRKRGRQAGPKVVETLTPEQRSVLQTVLEDVYESLINIEEPYGDAGDMRPLIDPFLELPDKFEYADYYQFIKNPICVNQIKSKINRKQYQSLKEFRLDVATLCNNCRTYNEDGSVLYQDANTIEETVVRRLKEETGDKPDLQDFDDSGSSMIDGRSTAPISSVGTPLAGAGRP